MMSKFHDEWTLLLRAGAAIFHHTLIQALSHTHTAAAAAAAAPPSLLPSLHRRTAFLLPSSSSSSPSVSRWCCDEALIRDVVP